jgi:hypothetical protein
MILIIVGWWERISPLLEPYKQILDGDPAKSPCALSPRLNIVAENGIAKSLIIN